ncbi:bifunctional glycosyltransferase/CDP-glycerol:glycerophosphate glycerophosphotransferase [Pradoshia eiseniae]|uniref:bifunctional glycosyltransferase/CDP-glycerol:glycerophosphate glycerophosphotransferase n=1 Tax=Pradoshia eiseniae TaxID=2064768 RepID=UPI0011B06CF0|nr:CDP-glycerol:glycerophosphate glycerophosphotransferase [Pradoshia eiseniae]
MKDWKVKNRNITRAIERLEWNEHTLVIEGYAYLNDSNMDRKDTIEKYAFLINTHTGEKTSSISLKSIKRTDISFVYGEEGDFDWSGYSISIDFDEFQKLDFLEGSYAVGIEYRKNGKIIEKFLVGSPIVDSLSFIPRQFMNRSVINADVNEESDFIIAILPIRAAIEDVNYLAGDIQLTGWISGTNRYEEVILQNDHTEYMLPIEINENSEAEFSKLRLSISPDMLDKLNASNELSCYLSGPDGKVPLFYDKDSFFIEEINGAEIVIMNKENGGLTIGQSNIHVPVLSEISWRETQADIGVRYPSSEVKKVSSLVLKHHSSNKMLEFDVFAQEASGDFSLIHAVIDLQNQKNQVPLNIGEWSIYLKIHSNLDDFVLTPLLYGLNKPGTTESSYLKFAIRKNPNGTSKLTVSHSTIRRLNPKISVILPVYNVEEYLEECLESLVAQSMKDFEVIMVDDGSLDGSRDIMAEYSNTYHNFIAIYKENGGLGHARNYGVSYASGDYIIFMDSDDYIADKAYELLLNSAENSGSDIVIGNVRRFNSTREFASGLHRKVFKETIIGTHITKNQELMYDTTAWNKLYKKSFWDEHQFAFPEGILYEDIPVTIPAHFLSKSTDILSEVIYYWRARDGASKSITQQRDQLKNFTDRLAVVKMVDSFFKGQEIDKELKIEKDYKVLNVDILLYLNSLDEVDEEYKQIFIQSVSDYLGKVDPTALERLNAIDRLKYHLIKEKNLEQLLEVLRFQKEELRKTKIFRDRDRYYGNYPFMEKLPKSIFDVTDELQVQRQIDQLRWRHNKLIISGYAYIDKIDMKRKSSVEMDAYIHNPESGKKVALKIENIKRPDVTHKKGIDINSAIPLKRLYNYHWSGFNITIDFDNPEIADFGEGRQEVWLTLKVGTISRTFRVGGPIAGKKPRPGMGVTSAQRIFPKYNAAWDLVIETSDVFSIINTITQSTNKLLINGWTELPVEESKVVMIDWARNISKSYPIHPMAIKAEEEKQIFTNRMKNGFSAEISLKDLNLHNSSKDWSAYMFHGRKRYPLTLMSKAKNMPTLIVGSSETQINMNPAGNMNIKFKKVAPYVKSCLFDNGRLLLEIRMHKSMMNEFDKINQQTVYLVSRGSGTKHNLSILNQESDGEYHVISCELDILSGGVAILEPGRWDLFITLDGKKGDAQKISRNRVEVRKSLSSLNKSKVISGLSITPYITDKGNFSFKVLLHWNKIERGPRRQEVIQKVLYPLFRLLPMSKKTVIFESYWGKSYSCNPRALYQYMSKEYKDYQYVWFFKNENIHVDGNAKKVRINSIKYYYYLARAKYFINNANFPDVYEKRRGAVEVQTLHGTPLKTMGLDVPGETDTKEKLEKFLNRCNRWDYLVSPSSYVSDISKRAFKFDRQLLEFGFPRNDMLKRNWSDEEIMAIKNKFHIPLDKKIVMYAPTWRVKKGFQLELNLDKMQEALGDEYVVLLRLHYFISSSINVNKYKGFVYDLSSHNDIQELYLLADLLITDYSSVMFDYANLNRPILFFTYDLEAYRDNLRGLYIDFEEEAPGPLLRDTEEIIDAIKNLDKVQAEYEIKFKQFRNKFCQFDNGNATQLVVEKMLNHKKAI